MTETLTDRADVRELVRQKYGAAALTVLEGNGAAGGGGNIGGVIATNAIQSSRDGGVITGGLYDDIEASQISEAAVDGRVMGAFIRATKPSGAFCGPSFCGCKS